jgi:4-nitrophenyl phosphatase
MKNVQVPAIRGLILDMDGVLWRGAHPIGDLPLIFSTIAEQGWQVILATNNSTRTVDQYLAILAGLGIPLEPWQVITSGIATADFLKRKYPWGGNVFVIGEPGLVSTLKESGFENNPIDTIAVVAGLDRTLDYKKLKVASLLIRSGVPFIGTNGDNTLPTPEGLEPGAGSILAALEAATDVIPTVIGKPNPEMFSQAIARLGTQPEVTLVIGDRLETDIAGGQKAGCLTGVVLSGVASTRATEDWEPSPDFIATNLHSLIKSLIDM